MICYQDEKMYGAPLNGITVEQLDNEIKSLELELYGEDVLKNREKFLKQGPMIYDVKAKKLVPIIKVLQSNEI